MKRKTEDGDDSTHSIGAPNSKRRVLSDETVTGLFRAGLFASSELKEYTKKYAKSAP
jgi:hypothetical protein